MKRRVIFVMILALVCICSAQADAYKDVNKYISQGLSDQNILKIKELSPQLTEQQKEDMKRQELLNAARKPELKPEEDAYSSQQYYAH